MELAQSKSKENSNCSELNLNQEQKEKVLNKLIDINSYGTAFTVLGAVQYTPIEKVIESKSLENIFKYGMLGQTGYYENGQTYLAGAVKKPITPESWKENVRSGKNTLIFFNIMGRGFNHTGKKINVVGGRIFNPDHNSNQEFLRKAKLSFEEGLPSLKMHKRMVDTYWFRYQKHAQVILTFDLKSYKEEREIFYLNKSYPESQIPAAYAPNSFFRPFNQQTKFHLPQRSYTAHVPPVHWEHKAQLITLNEQKEVAPRTDYGFTLSSRVAPRFLTGVVIKPFEHSVSAIDVNCNKKETQKLALEIQEIMEQVYMNKPELILPIYDIAGNLWYPEKITYQEIVQKLNQ